MKQKVQILCTEIKFHPSSDTAIEQIGKQILKLNIFRNGPTIIDLHLPSAHSPIKLVLINKARCLPHSYAFITKEKQVLYFK